MNASKSQIDASQRDDHAVARPANLKTNNVRTRAVRKAATKTRAPSSRKHSKARSPTQHKGPPKAGPHNHLLRKPEGATLDALAKATGWQPHSIRGFLVGTIRKKLKLPLQSEKVKGTRTYRIRTAKAPAKTVSSRPV